jgi:hypothetical protein
MGSSVTKWGEISPLGRKDFSVVDLFRLKWPKICLKRKSIIAMAGQNITNI